MHAIIGPDSNIGVILGEFACFFSLIIHVSTRTHRMMIMGRCSEALREEAKPEVMASLKAGESVHLSFTAKVDSGKQLQE